MIAFNDLGALSLPVLSTDILAASRDGVNAKRFTVADLFNAPAITGNATATTQATGNSSTRIATTAYVKNNLSNYGALAATNSWASDQKFGNGVGEAFIQISGAVNEYRRVQFLTGTDLRAEIGVDNFNESGADAGSRLYIWTYDDSGSPVGAITIPRTLADGIQFSRELFTTGDLSFQTGRGVKVNGNLVVTDRQTGWAAQTGTAARGAYATYSAPSISVVPTQAEVQGIADAVQAADRRLKALTDDLITHGMIGA